MTIFDQTIRRYRNDNIEPKMPKPSTDEKIPLAVSCYTPLSTNNHYDLMELFVHGGGIYTAVQYTIANKKHPLALASGELCDRLIQFHKKIKYKKPLIITTNPFNGKNVLQNVSIKSIVTFVTNDNSEIVAQLDNMPISLSSRQSRIIQYDGRDILVKGAKQEQWNGEFGYSYTQTATVVEFEENPNGDFIKTLQQNLYQGSNGQIDRNKKDLANVMITTHLPNLQIQLFNDYIAPNLASTAYVAERSETHD